MKRTRIYVVAVILLAIFALSGCKKVVWDMDYQITPWLQTEVEGEFTIALDIVAYAFYADTTQWLVASYSDAEIGVLTSRDGQSTKKQFDIKSEQDQDGILLLQDMTSSPVMIVVCNRAQKIYGWKQAETAPNLDAIHTSINFRQWIDTLLFDEAGWTMVNEFVAEP